MSSLHTSTKDSQLPRVFVLNLPDSTLRKEIIGQKLNDLGIRWEIIEAINGKNWVKEHNQEIYSPLLRKFLSAGEIGCFLSHKMVWEKIVAEDVPFALVLEDDTVVSSKVKDVLRSNA